MSTLALAVAVCLVVLVRAPARGGRGRDRRLVDGHGGRRELGARWRRPGWRRHVGAHGGARRGARWRRPGWWGPRRGAPPPDLGVLVTEVATRLRSGASVDDAWTSTLGRAGLVRDERAGRASTDGVPPQLVALGAGFPGRGRRGAAGATQRAALAATVAACRLTHEIGAPLADVLDRCAHGITEAAQAQDARRIALAGPRSTARLLAWLPGAGVIFGAGLGADPLRTLLDGSWGTASLVTGAALLAVGRRWIAALVAAAERGGENG